MPNLDRPIDHAAGMRIRHICLSYEPKIRSNLFGEQNISFETRTHARQCSNGKIFWDWISRLSSNPALFEQGIPKYRANNRAVLKHHPNIRAVFPNTA
jgi:hypothetical protein